MGGYHKLPCVLISRSKMVLSGLKEAQKTKTSSWREEAEWKEKVHCCRLVFDFISATYHKQYKEDPLYDPTYQIPSDAELEVALAAVPHE